MAAGDNAPAAQIKEVKEPTFNHKPEYQLTEPAYIDDKMLAVDAKVTWEGKPGHHMEPLNAHAKYMKEKHGQVYVDPIEALTRVS